MPDNNNDNKGSEGSENQEGKESEDQNVNNKGDDKGGEAGSKKTDTSKSEPFDASKIGDEDFEKVFEDPRLYKHSRFKSLNERAKKADDYEKAEEERKADELKKKGEFEKLAAQEKEKREAAEKKFQTAQIDNKIQAEASKESIGDLDAAIKLIDRSNIKVNDDGAVEGVEEAIKALVESKPYLKDAKSVNIGSGSAPGSDKGNAPKRFKLSEIQDPVFYRENEKDIDAAMKAGLIEDDMSR